MILVGTLGFLAFGFLGFGAFLGLGSGLVSSKVCWKVLSSVRGWGAPSADVLSPSRVQASFFYSREDRTRFAGMDAALRANLSEGLADGLDKEIIAGTNGLFTGTNLPNNAQTANDTFDTYLSHLVWDQIDGRYAAMASGLALVVGAATLKDLGSTYRNASVDRSALDRLMELTAGVRVSAHVPAPATNRQDAVIRRGMSTTATAPVWEGVTIIPDEVTKAKAGQIVITAVMLFAMKVLRTGAGPFAACGFNAALWGGSQAASVREAWRLALFGVLSPLGKMVESELQDKLEDTVTLSWQELRASDLSGRARAFQSMVNGGMSVTDAVSVAGLMIDTH